RCLPGATMPLTEAFLDEIVERSEDGGADRIECCGAFVIVNWRARPARGVVEPARNLLLQTSDQVAGRPQRVVFVAPIVGKAAAPGTDGGVVFRPNAVAIGKAKSCLPRPQEAVDRVAQGEF